MKLHLRMCGQWKSKLVFLLGRAAARDPEGLALSIYPRSSSDLPSPLFPFLFSFPSLTFLLTE